MAERNARGGLVCDRTALKNCEQNPAIALLKRQCRQPLEQIDRHIEALDAEIAALGAADAAFGRRHQILTSIAGVGTLTANQFIAAMPELGSLENNQAAALAGLAPGRTPVWTAERQELDPRWQSQCPGCPLDARSGRRALQSSPQR